MKNLIRTIAMASLVLAVTASCRDKETERRIADLEGRVSKLEGKDSGIKPEITPTAVAAPVVEAVPEGPVATMTFETTNHDFGTIKEGDEVEYTYKFKNTGDAPLIIETAHGSCGCTVPEWSKGEIAIGAEGFVKAKFNSANKKGFQNKTVTVTANTSPKQTQLTFVANVLPKDGAAK